MIERKSWLEKFVVICDREVRPLRKIIHNLYLLIVKGIYKENYTKNGRFFVHFDTTYG